VWVTHEASRADTHYFVRVRGRLREGEGSPSLPAVSPCAPDPSSIIPPPHLLGWACRSSLCFSHLVAIRHPLDPSFTQLQRWCSQGSVPGRGSGSSTNLQIPPSAFSCTLTARRACGKGPGVRAAPVARSSSSRTPLLSIHPASSSCPPHPGGVRLCATSNVFGGMTYLQLPWKPSLQLPWNLVPLLVPSLSPQVLPAPISLHAVYTLKFMGAGKRGEGAEGRRQARARERRRRLPPLQPPSSPRSSSKTTPMKISLSNSIAHFLSLFQNLRPVGPRGECWWSAPLISSRVIYRSLSLSHESVASWPSLISLVCGLSKSSKLCVCVCVWLRAGGSSRCPRCCRGFYCVVEFL
jgi:hypothetical protein